MREVLAMMIFAAVFSLAPVLPAAAQTEEGVEVKTGPKIEPEAFADLMEMTGFLSKAEKFSFTADVQYDVLQGNGQKLEFGGAHKVVVVRPDKLYSEVESRDGTKRIFIFDGKAIYYADLTHKVYATVPRPGDINQAIDYFTEDLDMPLPIGQVVSSDVGEMLKKEVYAGGFVEQDTINGILSEHLAFRTENLDFQTWIASEGDPIQTRLVIDYKNYPASPQYTADFKDWNFKPEVEDSLFVFKPADGMQKIEFAPVLRSAIKIEEKEEGKTNDAQ
jgi:hypothetical protein